MPRKTGPPGLSMAASRPPADYTPSPSNLKPQLVMRGASMPQMLRQNSLAVPTIWKAQHDMSASESFDEADLEMLECDDNVSVTSSEDVKDSFHESAASDESTPTRRLMRGYSGKWAKSESPTRRTRTDVPAWWGHTLSPSEQVTEATAKAEVDNGAPEKVDQVLYEAWWTRVRPAREEKAGEMEDPKVESCVASSARPARPMSQLEEDQDGHLRDIWWSSVRHRMLTFTADAAKQSSPLDRSPTSSSDALRHHDYTLHRAAGTRRGMRKDTSKRVKLESRITPLPEPVADLSSQDMTPWQESASFVGALFDTWWGSAARLSPSSASS